MNLIPERVARTQALTTHTSADRPHRMEERCAWSVQGAIHERVQEEDMRRWGKEPMPEFSAIAPIPASKPTALSLYRFMSGILP